jgi:hypothetical protein
LGSDLHLQLAALRRKVARIDRKYAAMPPLPPSAPRPAPDARPARYFIEEWMSGEEVETPHGRHFETERLYERHQRHGSMEISSLLELPDDLLGPLSSGDVRAAPVSRWAFLDTETTGLAGGAGTYAFLIGVGRVTPEGFRVRQFFMRDYAEEASLLWSLSRHLEQFGVLVTYNGKTYDQPLLETRYRMARARPPFGALDHLDLLHGARRLWKLRLESCRLVDLERQILGVEREGDIPGEMIPYTYFEYLRQRDAFRLVPVFHHNAIDILTTACLAAIVPAAFREPSAAGIVHGADLVGLARWFLSAGRAAGRSRRGSHTPLDRETFSQRVIEKPGALDRSCELLRRAVDLGLPDDLLFRALWDTAALEKKLGREAASLEILADLAASRNPFRPAALEALAKHYEHRERNYVKALETIAAARALADSEELAHRQARLERKMAKSKTAAP